ncbi:MAG: nucleotidyltransferase family protein [Gammaproteobacteria bacterium]|nr:nucleotidyltransferase family protein [Gammaproteobacteria bacterium]
MQTPLLVDCLLHPKERVPSLSLNQWDLLIRQARQARLMARLSLVCRENGVWDAVPEQSKAHLLSADTVAAKQRQTVDWEVHALSKALSRIDVPLVLLKGSAYHIAGLDAGRQRVFNDVDILVPRELISKVELTLRNYGWITGIMDSYDQRYYRKWMHELPPLRHITRKSSLDVHHSILPDTARFHPDPKRLLADAVCLDAQRNIYALSPLDRIIHSATHLFHEGEFENALRDLFDLKYLLDEFSGRDAQFWQKLTARAATLDLSLPTFYALHYCRQVLDSQIPQDTLDALRGASGVGLRKSAMDFLYRRVLRPDHQSCDDGFSGFARWCLFVRSHYMRMPLHLLVPHLFRKAMQPDSKG